MAVWRIAILAAALPAAWAAPSRADECEAVTANLGAQVPKIAVAARTAEGQAIIIQLKHPDADELTLSCDNTEITRQAEVTAKWNSAWPPARFFDIVASAGAVVVANTEAAVRSGAILCAQRAMTADGNSATFDVNGARFECVTTTGVNGSTRIHISKLNDAPPQ
ncbi:hypothetical protein [Hyphomicrobium sp.]|jgi:hypothetical protein|uniref:hypothetical protein n=1 Tax=Hyphomicrobium sp. TaxID=82 RepID=UPI003565CADC